MQSSSDQLIPPDPTTKPQIGSMIPLDPTGKLRRLNNDPSGYRIQIHGIRIRDSFWICVPMSVCRYVMNYQLEVFIGRVDPRLAAPYVGRPGRGPGLRLRTQAEPSRQKFINITFKQNIPFHEHYNKMLSSCPRFAPVLLFLSTRCYEHLCLL